ncbi:Site-specific recombinase XerD, partial [Gemmobacter megaterium]
EQREMILISLHTDSESVAKTKADQVWQELIEAWEAKMAGAGAEAEDRLPHAKELAARRGYRYLSARQVASLPVDDILKRVEVVPTRRGKVDQQEAEALLGGARPPVITVSRALEIYWTLAKDKTIGKSDDQMRRWENPRKKAIKNFISVVGDKALGEISGDDMLDFRDWWMERLEEEDLTPNSANKDLIHLGDVLKTVNRMKRLGLVLPLTDLSFKEGDAKKKPPFSVAWIKDKLLAPGALDGLNPEARTILLLMVNTGCRPSELAALTSNTIRLDHAVPHISIEPEGRHIKSKYARRTIPLLGVSLDAAKGFPNGFPRYLDSSASLSATVNKFLRENNLMESDHHTMYSLRHSFEDRMLAAGIDDRI